KAPVFYGLVAIGTIGGTLLSVFATNPIHLLVIVAVINGVAAAPFLILVMLISGDRSVMGKYRNGKLSTAIGWLAVALMATAAITLLVQSIRL
ncbi:MAG: hypothetical protein QOH29_845, partial [Actinomycetota bacterium]|nr:hypothetical protein [Actinomycetota bacterium]